MAIKLHYIKGMNQRLTMAIAAMLTLSPLANAQQERGVRVGTPGEMTGSPYRRVHVLLVGVNDYLSPTITDLRFAENDVAALRDVLEDRYGFSIPDSSVLLGKNATKGKITSALDSLADSNVVQEGDAIFVYFSMHGQSLPVRGGGMLGFLVPQDAQLSLKDRNAAIYHQNAISMQAVWDRLDTSPARHVLVVADACFSGLLVNDRGELPTNDGGDFFALNYGRTGREALVAGSAVQTTKEDDGRKHGRFTYAFVQELKNRANLGRQFVSVALVPVLKESATFGKEQSPEYGKRDGNAGTFTFSPVKAMAISSGTSPDRPRVPTVTTLPEVGSPGAGSSGYEQALAEEKLMTVEPQTTVPGVRSMKSVKLPDWAALDLTNSADAYASERTWIRQEVRQRLNPKDGWKTYDVITSHLGWRVGTGNETVHFSSSEPWTPDDKSTAFRLYEELKLEVASLRGDILASVRKLRVIETELKTWQQRSNRSRADDREAASISMEVERIKTKMCETYVASFDICLRLCELTRRSLSEAEKELAAIGVDFDAMRLDIADLQGRVNHLR